MEENFITLWNHIADIIRAEVGPDTFKRWFMPVELAQTDETQLTLRVPNNIFQLWIESNYMPLLQSAIFKVLGAPHKVKLVFDGEAQEAPKKKHQQPAAQEIAFGAEHAWPWQRKWQRSWRTTSRWPP